LRGFGAEHVPRLDERYETPKWRTFWLVAAFAVLVGIGVVTVLLPELEDEPEREAQTENQDADEVSHTDSLQE